MTKTQKITIASVGALLTILIVAAIAWHHIFMHKTELPEATEVIFIDQDDTQDSLRSKSGLEWRFDIFRRLMDSKVRTGRYEVHQGMRALELYRKLRNGAQDPMQLTLPSVRTLDRLAGYLGHQLMEDSAAFAKAFSETASDYGYTAETLPALFIPETYEIYWTVSPEGFMKRMERENKAFWNSSRDAKAKATGLTHNEVCTLASIIDEETANNPEKPMVAGMYLNRIRKGMLLQADPTVKFAMQAFGLRRIYFDHLKYDSPYNTYLYPGLPPGPIRIASVVAIDAVLNAAHHDYLYMCAKEDFSGTHNFARTYAEHLSNARRYSKALNERGIR